MSLSRAEQLWEIEQIKQLKARYFRLLDSNQLDAWSETFTEDAELRYPTHMGAEPTVVRGRETIRRSRSERFGEGATSVHRGFMPEIELHSENTAQGVWAMFDYIETAEGSRTGFGYYHDEYVKGEDGSWRIRMCTLVRQRIDHLYGL